MAPKRLGDVVIAFVALVLLAPLLLLCALLVRLLDGRPILFRQERQGHDGRRFRIMKFRTMRPSAGALVTTAGDARVTPLGRQLRRWKLDELPQFWNVLVGEMSLVGPRPEVPFYVDRHPRLFRGIASLRPGITDWSSLILRDEERILALHATTPGFYEDVLLPRKIALARLYRRAGSMIIDLRILLATLFMVLGLSSLGTRLAGRALAQHTRRNLDPREGVAA